MNASDFHLNRFCDWFVILHTQSLCVLFDPPKCKRWAPLFAEEVDVIFYDFAIVVVLLELPLYYCISNVKEILDNVEFEQIAAVLTVLTD